MTIFGMQLAYNKKYGIFQDKEQINLQTKNGQIDKLDILCRNRVNSSYKSVNQYMRTTSRSSEKGNWQSDMTLMNGYKLTIL